MARYSFKQFDLNKDVITQVNNPVNFYWYFEANGTGHDDSGDKWLDSAMTNYVIHGVASAGDTTLIKNPDGSSFDGNVTSEDLFYYIGTKHFGLNDPSNGIVWNGNTYTKFYAVIFNNELVLDRFAAGAFEIILNSATYTLYTPEDDPYPNTTTIRNNSGDDVGVAFLDEGIFCWFTGAYSNTQPSALSNFWSSACGGITGNSVEYQNSYIYFCRAYNQEFTYSLNPTYGVSASEYVGAYRVRNDFIDDPKAYITGIGLYDKDGELVALAKPSVPRKKDLYSEALFKIKLTL